MDPCLPKGPPETEQCIVPQLLIDHYVSMVDPSRAQTVDNDIARQYINSLFLMSSSEMTKRFLGTVRFPFLP